MVHNFLDNPEIRLNNSIDQNVLLGQILCSDIDDEGLKLLADSILNCEINNLDISFNNIGPKGTKTLVNSLRNSCVTRLNLAFNDIGKEGENALVNLMKTNSQITKLEFMERDMNLEKKSQTNKDIISKQCALNAQKNVVENAIAGALDLLTRHAGPIDGNITSVPEVNDLIAEKLFMLDKAKKLNYIKLIQRPHSVINQYA